MDTRERYVILRLPKCSVSKFFQLQIIRVTSTETAFTPGGEPPLVPVPHPGASIQD